MRQLPDPHFSTRLIEAPHRCSGVDERRVRSAAPGTICFASARLSAAIFAAALILFAAGHHHDRRLLQFGIRLFAGFVGAHTIHFGAVAWLAVVTAGENIRERDGWPVVVTVALLFYMAAFVVLRAWGDAGLGASRRGVFGGPPMWPSWRLPRCFSTPISHE